MGFGGSADIFQAQIMDLMASLEFVQAYMDDLLTITRRTLDEHLQRMETVLTKLCDTGLKVNMAKSSFRAHEIEYLGYILTRERIKPQPKKVQVILVLNPSNNVKELRHLIGMVQYYRDMWARCSEMLAPLTDLVGECGETKTTRMNKTKMLDIEYLTIHVDAGAMAFTRRKYLPPRLAAETCRRDISARRAKTHSTQHSQVIYSLFVDHLNSVT